MKTRSTPPCPPNLHAFVDLRALIRQDGETPAQRRRFGLEHESLLKQPLKLLLTWCAEHRHRLDGPQRTDTFFSRLHAVRALSDVSAFVLGMLTAAGLLTYNGSAPVNLLYFLLFALVLPLLGSLLSLIALLRTPNRHAVRFDADAIFQRLFAFISRRRPLPEDALPAELARLYGLMHSQRLALLFSSGMLLSLLVLVASTDIAFGWGTTLQLSPQTFSRWIGTLALPWKTWLPDAVPSAELVAHSRFFRLGGTLEPSLVAHAAELGAWWRFLAMTLLVYAVVPRLLLWLFARYRFGRALRQAMLSLDGVPELLAQMREPLVLMHAEETETPLQPHPRSFVGTKQRQKRYDTVLGWALERAEIAEALRRYAVETPSIREAGGRCSPAHDRETVQHCQGDAAVFVKAWEPPTMDFVDFLLDLAHSGIRSVDLFLLGQDGEPQPQEREIWNAKIGALGLNTVRFAR